MIGARLLTVASLVAPILGLPHAAAAQEISKGLNLAGLSLSYDHGRGGGNGLATNTGLGFERLLGNRLGAAPSVTYNREHNQSFGEGSLAATYYFKPKQAGSAYAVARGGLAFGRDPRSYSLSGGIGYLRLLGAQRQGAGVKVELTYSYRRYRRYRQHVWVTDCSGILTGEDEIAIPASHANGVVLSAGISFYFRSKR